MNKRVSCVVLFTASVKPPGWAPLHAPCARPARLDSCLDRATAPRAPREPTPTPRVCRRALTRRPAPTSTGRVPWRRARVQRATSRVRARPCVSAVPRARSRRRRPRWPVRRVRRASSPPASVCRRARRVRCARSCSPSLAFWCQRLTCVVCLVCGGERTAQAGSYSQQVGGAGATACLACGVDSFITSAGQAACFPCAGGFFAPATGLSVCRACSPGSAKSTSGLPACPLCEAGTFSGASGAVTCTPCAQGRGAVYFLYYFLVGSSTDPASSIRLLRCRQQCDGVCGVCGRHRTASHRRLLVCSVSRGQVHCVWSGAAHVRRLSVWQLRAQRYVGLLPPVSDWLLLWIGRLGLLGLVSECFDSEGRSCLSQTFWEGRGIGVTDWESFVWDAMQSCRSLQQCAWSSLVSPLFRGHLHSEHEFHCVSAMYLWPGHWRHRLDGE